MAPLIRGFAAPSPRTRGEGLTAENLYQVPVAGGEPKAITNFPDGSIANFAWSPDGSRIVLTHYLQTRDVVMLNAAR